MAERRHPVVRARLYEPGRRWVQRYDGFGRYDVVADLWRKDLVKCSVVSPSELGVGAGMGRQAEVPAAMVVEHEGLNLAVCRPFLDTRQAIGQSHFDLYGGQWLPLEGLGIGNEVRLYQYDGRAAAPTGAVSRFTLPHNPVLCVSLHRAEPAPGHDWSGTPPCTEVHLGVGSSCEWAVVLPYGGPPFVMRRRNGEWQQVASTGRSIRARSLEGDVPGQRQLLWMAVWRGRLVLSTDGFVEDVWACGDGAEAVDVPEGKVGLWHNAGQWAFSFIPMLMASAVLDSLPIEAGYDTDACAGELVLAPRTQPVLDGAGQVLADVSVADVTDERADLTNSQRAWRATITPYVHSQTDPPFETAVSPELHAVQLGQYAEIVDTGLQSWGDISEHIKRVSGRVSADGRAALYEVSADNVLGQLADLREYRECHLELGWTTDDGNTAYEPAICGYLAEPEPAVTQGPEDRMQAVVLDATVRLRDEKCDGRAPVFDGWPVVDVFAWVLDRCGLPASARNVEDTEVRLSTGAFDRPLWQAEPGRQWLEFLAEVAQFDHRAGLFFDPAGIFWKACPFCRRGRTAADVVQHDGDLSGACGGVTAWDLYTRAALGAPPDGRCSVLSIERRSRSLERNEFANYVAVCGMEADGTPVRSTVFDPASLYDPESAVFVGWRKMEVLALETYTSQAETNRLAQEIHGDRSQRPEHLAVVIPLEPGIRVGHLVQVHGGETLGVGERKYRVESLRHVVKRDAGKCATTEVVGRLVSEG